LGLGLLGASALVLPGCVVAVGNRSDGYVIDGEGMHARRVQLSPEERTTLPEVVSVADLPTVRSRYADDLSRLGPSTTVEEFQAMFPQARFVERRFPTNVAVDAYSVTLEEKFRYRGKSYGLAARDEMWFYFENEMLVKRGRREDWPEVAK
jgi:hypothetical protein